MHKQNMEDKEIIKVVQEIVFESKKLKDKHTEFKDSPANYVCIFSQSNEEFEKFKSLALEIGEIIEDTYSGPLFQISPIDTTAGKVKLLKVRQYDATRPERGDSDFTVENYAYLKEKYLDKDVFSLITREDFEMIEIVDPEFNVRVYFSNPPLDKQLGI